MSTTAATTRNRPWALLLPGLIVLVAVYLLPMLWVVRMSVNRFAGGGRIEQTVTLDSFAAVLTDPYYLRVAGTTLLVGVLTALFTVVLAYPVALFLARTSSRFRGVLLLLAITPMLVSAVARTYGWMVILGPSGLISTLAQTLGLSDRPVTIAYTVGGVVIAMVQIFLPYAVLALVSGFGRLSSDLEDAAGSLGANRWNRFARVTLPLTAPGLLSAALLVFILSISAYVTPRLIGGGRVPVLAAEIYMQATNQLNWPVASALSILLILIFGVALFGSQLVQRSLERRVSGL